MSTRCRADLSASLGRAVIVGMAGLFGFSGFFWQPATCIAHEVRPSYLELREDRAGEFDVLLKTPMRGELRLALAATFSGRADAITPITMRATGDAAVQTWRFKALDPLPGTRGQHGIEGLNVEGSVCPDNLEIPVADPEHDKPTVRVVERHRQSDD